MSTENEEQSNSVDISKSNKLRCVEIVMQDVVKYLTVDDFRSLRLSYSKLENWLVLLEDFCCQLYGLDVVKLKLLPQYISVPPETLKHYDHSVILDHLRLVKELKIEWYDPDYSRYWNNEKLLMGLTKLDFSLTHLKSYSHVNLSPDI